MNTPELLAKLRQSGIRRLTDDSLLEMSERAAAFWPTDEEPIHLLADLLEARARLDAVREWAERHASEPAASEGQAVGRLCGREVLGILGRTP